MYVFRKKPNVFFQVTFSKFIEQCNVNLNNKFLTNFTCYFIAVLYYKFYFYHYQSFVWKHISAFKKKIFYRFCKTQKFFQFFAQYWLCKSSIWCKNLFIFAVNTEILILEIHNFQSQRDLKHIKSKEI